VATATRSRPTVGSPRRILWIVLGALSLGALLFAAFGIDSPEAASVEEVAGDPAIGGDALPPLEDPATDPTLGGPAPEVVGAGFDGEGEATIADGGGELVVFLASWCPACQAEVPELVEWVEAGGLPDDVELTAVVTGLDATRPNWPPQEWLEEEGWPGAVLVDDADGSVAAAYGLSGTPFTVAVRDGEVVARFAGQLPAGGFDELAAAVSGG
jgi:thiol-disulfide isomerase/thioredoxin